MTDLLHQIDPVARVVVTLLFNSIWQGAIVVAAVWLITRSIERTNATTRYVAWCLTLGAILIVPLATTLPAAMRQTPVVIQTLQRFAPIEAVQPAHTAQKNAHATNSAPARQPAATQHAFAQWWPPVPARLSFNIPSIAALAIFFVWLAVAVVLAVKLGIAIARLERLKRDAMPLPIEYRDKMEAWPASTRGKRRVRLCISRDVDVPVAVGLFDSMILIPTTLLEQLSEQEIDQISLHELAHLRRWDDWTNGAQRLMQALFFFNPAMAWISRQLNLEREVACDDWVLSQTGNARPYATCLTKLAEVTVWPNAAIAAPGAFITRKNISIRIERLLDSHRNARPGLSLVASGATIAAVALALVFSSYVTPVIAYDESSAPPTKVLPIESLDRVVPLPVEKPVQKVAASKPIKAQAKPLVHVVETAKPSTRVVEHVAVATMKALPVVAPAAPSVAASAARAAAMSVDVQQIVREVVPEALHEASEAMKDIDVNTGEHKGSSIGMHCNGCSVENANWAGRDLRNADLAGSNVHNSNLSGADLRGARLSGANLHGVDLQNSDLRGANFTGANFSNVNLRGAKLEGARFSGASIDIRNLDPQQARAVVTSCTGCNFAGANLRGMDLSGLHMSGMNLEGADLRDCNLSKARMVGVNLAGAKLEGANLRGATLSGANLDRVDLRRVDLTDVDLTGSNISTAILK